MGGWVGGLSLIGAVAGLENEGWCSCTCVQCVSLLHFQCLS